MGLSAIFSRRPLSNAPGDVPTYALHSTYNLLILNHHKTIPWYAVRVGDVLGGFSSRSPDNNFSKRSIVSRRSSIVVFFRIWSKGLTYGEYR